MSENHKTKEFEKLLICKNDEYYSGDCDNVRYLLWLKGNRPVEIKHKNPLFVIGLNPSKATLDKSDQTISKVKEFTRRFGYESFIMFNLYPERSTDPNKLPKEEKSFYDNENKKAFEWALNKCEGDVTFWCAWGNNILNRKYLKNELDEIIKICEKYKSKCQIKWSKAGELTLKNNPRHPSRLSYEAEMDDDGFEIDDYVSKL